MRRNAIPVILTAVVLAAPVGAATWYGFGTYEPDNAYDIPSFMWANPAPPGAQRVYLNAITSVWGLVNPNVGLLETRNEIPTLEFHQAMFGIWIDCNGDGYVGLAETAAQEYRSNLLLDTTVCQPATGTPNSWTPGAHNYNGWVTEYVPIGGVTTDGNDDHRDLRIYRDPQAMVWGDFGRPDEGAEAGGTCAIRPFPRGTWSSTGGVINHFDCMTGLMERWNDAWLGRSVAGQEIPGLTDLGAPSTFVFADPDDARGSWADLATFGSEDASQSAVHFSDCEADPALRVGDELNETLGPSDAAQINRSVHDIVIHSPDPRVGNTNNPTAPATVNATLEETGGDCDYSNDRGADFYGTILQEGDFQGVSDDNKIEADWNLQFEDTPRGDAPWNVLGASGNAGATPHLGIRPLGDSAGFVFTNQQPSGWSSTSVLVKTPRTVRASLAAGTVDLADAYYLTFYAFAGTATTQRGFEFPSAIPGTYGAAQCGSNDSGIHNGWNCDRTKWYVNPDGSPQPRPRPFAEPGQAYQLRDVDCYDGDNRFNVGAGAPAYGPNPCAE